MRVQFIIERPIQLITALSIAVSLPPETTVKIVIADEFEDAKGIFSRCITYFPSCSFTLVDAYADAIEYCYKNRADKLFIHWDVGFGTRNRLRRMKALHPDISISVFEEGVGTYRADIYSVGKRIIFKILGLPVNVGGSKYIDEIYVYDPDSYKKTAYRKPSEIRKIVPDLADAITNQMSEFVSVFGAEEFFDAFLPDDRRDCTIFLSDWSLNADQIKGVFVDGDVNVLKLHPHCRMSPKGVGAFVPPAGLPAEILVLVASRFFNMVKVIHRGSSTSRYIRRNNVIFTERI